MTPEDYLHTYRNDRGVRWVAVDLAAIDEILAAALLAGIEFSERLALVDLHAAVTRDDLRPFRFYAARWKWSPYQTRALFEREGLLAKRSSRSKSGATSGAQEAHKRRTKNSDSSGKTGSGRTRGAQEAHSILLEREEEKRESPVSPAPGAGDVGKGRATPSDQGSKKKPAKRRRTPADETEIAAQLAERITYPPALDTPDVRAEFARWILFRMFTLPRAKTGTKIAGDPLEYFQTQIDHATRSGKYYIPGGAPGYVAALVESRGRQWQHPYADKDFNAAQNGAASQPIQRLI